MIDRQNHTSSSRQARSRLVPPAISRLSHALGTALSSPRLPAPALAPPSRPPSHRPGWQYRAPRAGATTPATARASRYRPSPRLQTNGKGLALLELMIAVGTIMVVSGGIFAVYKVTDSRQRADREIRNAGEIVDNISRVMVADVDFKYLNQQYAIDHHIFPDRMVDGTRVSTSWGGLLLEPTEVNEVPNQGALLTYNNVPSSSCVSFVRGASNGFYEIRVNDQVLRTNYGVIQPTDLTNLCNSQERAKVELVFARNAGTGLAVDELSPCVAPPPETSVSACPPGELGSVTRTRAFTCSSPWGSATPGPWSAPVSTCTPACVVPDPDIEYENEGRTADRTQACPSGQVTPSGETSFTQTRQEERTHSRTASCPAPTGPYVWSPWSPWSPWSQVSGPAGVWDPANGCAPQCVVPSPSSQTETQTRNVTTTDPCPTGQVGEKTYTHQERSARTRTASCPAPTGASTWSPWSPYGPWSPAPGAPGKRTLVSDTCAPECVAPPPSSTTENSFATCPAGSLTPTGSKSFTQTRTLTQSYSCPSPGGPYTPSPVSYSPWSPPASSACAPRCTAPAPTTESRSGPSETQSLSCPYYQTGNIEQRRAVTQTRTVSYSCSSPTGPAVADYGPWTPSSYGPWSTTSSKCALPACDGTLEGNAKNYMSRYGDLYNAFAGNWNGAYQHWYTYGYSEGRGSCWPAPCVAPPPTTQTAPGATQYDDGIVQSQAGRPEYRSLSCPLGAKWLD